MAGSGLDVSATGQLGIDINELPALANFAGGDLGRRIRRFRFPHGQAGARSHLSRRTLPEPT